MDNAESGRALVFIELGVLVSQGYSQIAPGDSQTVSEMGQLAALF
jgi:hypothetical protein